MLLYLAPVSAESQMNVSPEEMKKGMEPWMQWYGKVGAAIVDGGSPLGNGMHFSGQESSKPKTTVAGYTVVQAENMDTVKKMIENHPHYMLKGASIEVLEVMPMSL